MQPDTAETAVATEGRRRWWAPLLAGDLAALWPAIVVAFIGVLLIAFAMSYHGLYVFGERIMRWPQYLCILAPVGLDVFSLVVLLATFLTRDAHWRVRVYCWVALLFTVTLSIAGNAISAYSLLDAVAGMSQTAFRWGYAQVSAIGAAAVWPALSAIALHVLIVVRRHLDERRDKIRTSVAAVREQQDAEERQQARALVLAAEGASINDILEDLTRDLGYAGSRRTVERWTEKVRDALAASRNGQPVKVATKRVTGRSEPKAPVASTVQT